MNLILTPKQAAPILQCDERTVRNRIRRGAIKNVIDNGCGIGNHGSRYLIDMTKEYGMERSDVAIESAAATRSSRSTAS